MIYGINNINIFPVGLSLQGCPEVLHVHRRLGTHAI